MTLTVGKELSRSVQFFDSQFQRQVRERDFHLNPFENLALPYLRGRLLDLGCGLGNLSLEAARRGCSVLALDASETAIDRLRSAAAAESLAVEAEVVDLASYRIPGEFDTIVAIGLLMFMDSSAAHRLLEDVESHVKPGGCAIVNVLIEGTTYTDMFEPGSYYLFAANELQERFQGWNLLESRTNRFDAPNQTEKVFATIVARKAAAGS